MTYTSFIVKWIGMECSVETDRRKCTLFAESLSPQEFDAFYDHYKTDVYHFILHLTQNRAEAEDIFQEVWLRVIKHFPNQEYRQKLKPWLITIALNLHRDRLRKRRIRRLFLLNKGRQGRLEAAYSETPASVSSDPSYSVERLTLQQNINKAIARLPEKQRRIFVLKEIEGLPQAEIAGILGIPIGTVKSLMHRAVKALQRELAAHNPKGERVKCDVRILSV